MPPGSHASIGDQVYSLVIHEPVGAPRTTSPSKPRLSSTRVCAPCVPAYGLPTARCSLARSAGASAPSCRAVAWPSRRSAAIVSARASRTQAAPSSATPLSTTSRSSRRHSTGASAAVHAACTTRASSGVSTHSVRRMAWWRTRLRSSYSAVATAGREGSASRAAAER